MLHWIIFDHILIAFFGLVVWVGLFGTLLGKAVQAKLPQAPSGIMVTIAAHLVFGLGLAGFTRMLYTAGKEEDQKEEKVLNRVVPVPVKKILLLMLRKGRKKAQRADLKNLLN